MQTVLTWVLCDLFNLKFGMEAIEIDEHIKAMKAEKQAQDAEAKARPALGFRFQPNAV